ncbi:hypothetical protein D3C76_1159620 [compost metagenome]
MSGDFLVGETLQGLAQQALGFVEIAHAIVDPTQAVEHRGVVRVDLVSLVDQCLGFGIARGAVGQGVAQGVEGHGVFRLAGNDAAQVLFHLGQVVALLGQHGAGVQQVVVVRVLLQGLFQHLQGLGILVVVAQCLGFDQVQLDDVVRLGVAGQRQAP